MEDINIKKIKKELKECVRKYKLVKKDVQDFTNRHQHYAETLENEIFLLMDELNIDEYDGVKKENYFKDKTLSISQLKELFNDKNMIDHIVVTVSLPLTAENLKIKNGFSTNITKGFIELLNKDVRTVQVGLTIT